MLGTRIDAPIRHQCAKNHAMHPPSGCCSFSGGSIHTKRLFVVLRTSWCATEKLYGTTHATRFVYTSSDHATQRTPVDTKESFFQGCCWLGLAEGLHQNESKMKVCHCAIRTPSKYPAMPYYTVATNIVIGIESF